jgi:hypothetical protein
MALPALPGLLVLAVAVAVAVLLLAVLPALRVLR